MSYSTHTANRQTNHPPFRLDSLESAAEVLSRVRNKGVRVWSSNGQLCYKAPKGALTAEDIERLKKTKEQIVALLDESSPPAYLTPIPTTHPTAVTRAHLSYAQLAHWQVYRLAERPTVRQIASATRLHGYLNLEALRSSLTEIVRRQSALRTRIVDVEGTPYQEIDPPGRVDLPLIDLQTLWESFREIEIRRQLDQLILEPINPAKGPLFAVRLLKLTQNEHALLVAMEHTISDGYSINLFVRELLKGYAQVVQGRAVSLPPVPVQLADYAEWQRSVTSDWLERHGEYWNTHLAGCPRVRFPEAPDPITANRLGWGTVAFQIEPALRAELREWARTRQTTLVMTVFTAYTALILRWCQVSDMVIQYVADSRVQPELEHTIGFFASMLYVRATLGEQDSFLDLLTRLTGEYCQAYEHADFSYLESRTPRPAFAANAIFNWIPQGTPTALRELTGSADQLVCSPIDFENPMLDIHERDSEPVLLLYDTDEAILGRLHYPRDRFSASQMQSLTKAFLGFLDALLRRPEARVPALP